MQVENIGDLFEAQRHTDAVILDKRGLTRGGTFEKRVLALIVELGEVANEWRAFKFWSEDQKPRVKVSSTAWGAPYENPLLEEYVDCLHFIVSLAIDLEIEQVEFSEVENNDSIERHFIGLTNTTSLLLFKGGTSKRVWRELFNSFIHLGERLGFTWDEVYAAYFDKNAVNHKRQQEGY